MACLSCGMAWLDLFQFLTLLNPTFASNKSTIVTVFGKNDWSARKSIIVYTWNSRSSMNDPKNKKNKKQVLLKDGVLDWFQIWWQIFKVILQEVNFFAN